MAKKVGRPTKYTPAQRKKAAKLALLGLTDKQMAAALEISTRTLHVWKRDYPEFVSSINAGKDLADAEVAHSLWERANGYKHPAVKIMQHNGVPVKVRYIEQYPPDTVAAIFWLKNRQPGKFRDKPEPSDGDDDIPESKPFTYTVVDGRVPENGDAD